MEKDLVSIIIPTHNRAKYLKKQIASALNQTYKHIEIIVIANGCKEVLLSIEWVNSHWKDLYEYIV